MAKDFQERVAERKQSDARHMFSSYVQSVAFNMTLSRNMVDALCAVRDFGGVISQAAKATVNQHVGSHSAPLMGALMRRGLVWHDCPETVNGIMREPPGHRWFKLTRAGELMCELLVEAGLIGAAGEQSQKRKA